MRKTIAAISVLALAAFATSATAQTTSQPNATTTETPSPAIAPAGQAGEFLTQAQVGHWRASKLVGVDIYGPDNAKVGDVDEVMIDQNGSVVAVIIGVGGFLGIGAKDVALPMKSIKWEMTPRSTSATPSAGTGSNVNQDYPAYGVVQATKEQLQNAPTFRYVSSNASSATTPATAPSNRPASRP